MIRIIGLDPGLQRTGWGVVESDGNRLSHVAHGTVTSRASADLAARLLELYEGLTAVFRAFPPAAAHAAPPEPPAAALIPAARTSD